MLKPPNQALKKQKLFHKTEQGYLSTSKSSKKSTDVKQTDIARAVDITNATKHFELELDKLGPYKCNYYKNGRLLLLGGKLGHIAAFDWLTKDLLCEFNVRETVHAVQWLHMPNMYAVAQKDWVHIYDRDGIELNVIKTMYRAEHLDFLEHHFLLAAASDKSYVSWKDISIGKDIASFPMKHKPTSLTHNPYNGLLLCSHPNGTVTMWSPNHNRPALSMLCHPASVRGLSSSIDGKYFATTGVDKTIRLWDLRNNYKCLKEHKIPHVPDSVHFSQLGLLAVATGTYVNIYKNAYDSNEELTPYLRHNVGHIVNDVYFCNFEDVVGVGHQNGFTSLLVPGSGEPNFDSHEANPFMSKTQQREMEVKLLLDKVSHEMICLDPSNLARAKKDK